MVLNGIGSENTDGAFVRGELTGSEISYILLTYFFCTEGRDGRELYDQM